MNIQSPDPLYVLSLGAGVQSTAVLMLALEGELPCDAAIFADTGWEPRAVYEHLERLESLAAAKDLPLHRVSAGSIRDVEGRQQHFYEAPYYLVNPDGSHGMARRQCTHQLKIRPIRWKIRELMAARGLSARPGSVVQYLGISWDELQRVKPADVRFVEHRWPLVDRRWTRTDCVAYLDAIGMTVPRSACIGCPYRSNAEWRMLARDAPDEFADAVAFESELQGTAAARRGKPYLHASRRPLDTIDFSNAEDRGQLTFDAECAGMCSV